MLRSTEEMTFSELYMDVLPKDRVFQKFKHFDPLGRDSLRKK
ncbi:MAG: hypothetical protein ACMUEL_05310 [Flavobacteriales bacterium Tduv]